MKIANDLQCQRATAGNRPRIDIAVDGTPGLALRVTADGVRTWSLRYRRQVDGKLRRLTLGTYPDVGLKDARERARIARNSVSAGDDPAGAKLDRRAADTFHGLATQWIAFKQRQGRSGSYTKRSTFRLDRLPSFLTDMKACEVQRSHVTGALDKIAKRGATTEVNRYHAFISAVFKWAVSEGLMDHDPSQGIKKRFEEEPRERVWTAAELKAFWQGIGTAPAGEATRIAMRLVIALGQRPKEIAHMRRDKLALDGPNPTLTIPRETAKNRTEHVVPLPRMAVAMIREALALNDSKAWVFPAPYGDEPLDPHSFAVILHRARDTKAATLFGLTDVQLYDARKTMATFLGDAGHPDQFVGLLLNHMSAKTGTVTGRHYNHARYLTQKRDMIEQWARHLEAVLGEAAEAGSNIVQLGARTAVAG